MSTMVSGIALGFKWIREGWRMFMVNPSMWTFLSSIWFLVALVLVFVPMGGYIWWLLGPAVYAGFLYSASEIEQGRHPEPGHLFRGLGDPQRRWAFVSIGAVTMFGYLIMSMVLSSMSFGAGPGPTVEIGAEEVKQTLSGAFLLSIALRFILVVVIGALMAIALIFSAPLVMFGEMDGLEAIMTSAEHAMQHWRPVLIIGIVYTLVAAMGFLIFLLPKLSLLYFVTAVVFIAVGVLVIAPVIFCASYVSFRHVFQDN